MKCLVFDIKGDLAHFGAYYSTSSPVSFSAPPPVTVLGMIGAILGLEKKENAYLSILNQSCPMVAVGLRNPIKKIYITENFVNTQKNYWVPVKKTNHEPHTQIQIEFVKAPCYRIWFTCQDSALYETLKTRLQNHQMYYTLSLGLSELLATYDWVGEDELIKKYDHPEKWLKVHSLFPVEKLFPEKLNIETGFLYLKEMYPAAMNFQRIVQAYKEYMFDLRANALSVQLDEYWQGQYGNILLTNCATGQIC